MAPVHGRGLLPVSLVILAALVALPQLCFAQAPPAPVMDPEPAQTVGKYNEVSWTHAVDPRGMQYYAVCDNTADCSSPLYASGWRTDKRYTFGAFTSYGARYYRVQARFQGISPANRLWEENFEDGNYDGWFWWTAGPAWAVTDETGANGSTHSLRCIGGGQTLNTYITPPVLQPQWLTFWVRTAKNNVRQVDFHVADEALQNMVFFDMDGNGHMYMQTVNAAGTWTAYDLGAYETLRWYKITYTFGWASQVVHVFVDGVLKATGVPFAYRADGQPWTTVGCLKFYNPEPSVSWLDEITLHTAAESTTYSAWSEIVSSTQVADSTGPTCTITYPENGQKCLFLPNITGTATDPEPGTGVAKVEVYLARFNTTVGQPEYWRHYDRTWATSVNSSYFLTAEGTTDWWLNYNLPHEWETAFPHYVYARATDAAGNPGAWVNSYFWPIDKPLPPVLAELPETTTGDTLQLRLTDPNWPPCDEYRIQVANSEEFDPVYDTGWITRGALSGGSASFSGAGGELSLDGSRIARAGGALPIGLSLLGMVLSLVLLPALGRGRRWRVSLRLRGRKGFMVTELLVSLGIIAILAALLIPAFAHVRGKGRVSVPGTSRIGLDFDFNQSTTYYMPVRANSPTVPKKSERDATWNCWYLEGHDCMVAVGGAQLQYPIPPEQVRGFSAKATVYPTGRDRDNAMFAVGFRLTTVGSYYVHQAGFSFERDGIYAYVDQSWGAEAVKVGEWKETSGKPHECELIVEWTETRRLVRWLLGGNVVRTLETTKTLWPHDVAIGLGSGGHELVSTADTGAWFDDIQTKFDRERIYVESDWSNTVSTYWDPGDQLQLTNLRVSRITTTSAVVNWETTHESSTEVAYGTAPSLLYEDYPNQATGSGGTKFHSVLLTNLAPDTTYYLRARSATPDGPLPVISTEITFRTLPLKKLPSLVYCGDTSAAMGADLSLKGTLSWNGQPVAGRWIKFMCGDFTGEAYTSPYEGIASLTVDTERLGAGTHTVRLWFDGDDEYGPAEATATITIAGPTELVAMGTGKFYREGDPKKLCMFDFAFRDSEPDTGWLDYKDLNPRSMLHIRGIVVDNVIVDGDEITAYFHVGTPAVYYTLRANAATDYFYLAGGGYEAYAGLSPKDKVDIRIGTTLD